MLYCDHSHEAELLARLLINNGYKIEKKFTASSEPVVILENGAALSGYSYIKANLWLA